MMVAVVVMMHLSSRFQRNITSSHGSLPAYSSILSYVLTTPHFVSSTLYHIFFYVRSILCPYLVSSSFFFFKFNITIMRQDRTVHRQLPKDRPGLLPRPVHCPTEHPGRWAGRPTLSPASPAQRARTLAKLAARVVSNGSVVQQQDLAGQLGLSLLPQVDSLYNRSPWFRSVKQAQPGCWSPAGCLK